MWPNQNCNFCTAKETIKKMKRQVTDWEKIFPDDVTDNGVVSNMYKQPIKLYIKKPHNLIKKWTENLNRHFSKEDIQMANRHMQRCSRSLITREMQIKTTMRSHFIPIRMSIIKKIRDNKCWQWCGENEPLCIVGGNVNWFSHYGKHRGFSKN